MATTEFKLPISVAKFPFNYHKASRAAWDTNKDVTARTPLSLYGAPENIDYNVLQLLLAENVWPIDTGLMSVGYLRGSTNTTGANVVDEVFHVDYDTRFAPAGGANYFFSVTSGAWVSKNPLGAGIAKGNTTFAKVAGRAFAAFNGIGSTWREYIYATQLFPSVTPTLPSGVVFSNVIGICAAGNYLVAYTTGRVLWSSLTNPLNFDDTVSGSGNAIPTQMRGVIIGCVPSAEGFIIYTDKNAVAATATGDGTRPFAFREIRDCGGVLSRSSIAGDAGSSGHYAFTSYGLQWITAQKGEIVFPDVSDFLAGQEHARWNGSNIDRYQMDNQRHYTVGISFLYGRYLCLSYDQDWTGAPNQPYRFALVYDQALRRWGKLRLAHSTIMDVDTTTGNILGLIGKSGIVDRLVGFPSYPWRVSGLVPAGSQHPTGTVVFGHIKSRRGKHVTLQNVIADGAENGGSGVVNPCVGYILPSLAGATRDVSAVAMTATADGTKSTSYRKRYTADNFDIVLQGKFDLTTVIVEVTEHGSR